MTSDAPFRYRDVVLSDGGFYRGFFIRRHIAFNPERPGATFYIVCARFADGGDEQTLDSISHYLGTAPEECRVNREDTVVSVGDFDIKRLVYKENLLKYAIDSHYRKLMEPTSF